ncbi:hypothetical protein GALMADRAFT_215469 [Galerina marginata CBS 339.88]|uniref:Uncharacterized protein n=1 Tax=Galerina marginata (strain CBS 339.88) TaxID=685588 RepID=A0A067SQ27_GALM3|nr:hypothetical protein GALMADRAFT_215469 [Galerina marginata CBS 339.88]
MHEDYHPHTALPAENTKKAAARSTPTALLDYRVKAGEREWDGDRQVAECRTAAEALPVVRRWGEVGAEAPGSLELAVTVTARRTSNDRQDRNEASKIGSKIVVQGEPSISMVVAIAEPQVKAGETERQTWLWIT